MGRPPDSSMACVVAHDERVRLTGLLAPSSVPRVTLRLPPFRFDSRLFVPLRFDRVGARRGHVRGARASVFLKRL